ncbi:hypothetical protein [Micromonospora sp. WMMD736]|uniref:hypothetical protein n=1 Tax=Micromonospora sp. WMMD736 TaxID=3404112 RepID=UPI003B934179
MSDVALTMHGDTLVVEAGDLPTARQTLAEYATRESFVWITNAESGSVWAAYDLAPEEIEGFARGLSEDEYDELMDAEFVRHCGDLYPITEFSRDAGITRGAGLPEWMQGWHAHLSESAFSGLLLRYHQLDPDDDGSPVDMSGGSGVTIARYILS